MIKDVYLPRNTVQHKLYFSRQLPIKTQNKKIASMIRTRQFCPNVQLEGYIKRIVDWDKMTICYQETPDYYFYNHYSLLRIISILFAPPKLIFTIRFYLFDI